MIIRRGFAIGEVDRMKDTEKKRIQQKINDTYIPLKELIFEDNEKEIDVVNNFTDYSHVLANIELIIHSFITANPETTDKDILYALKKARRDPLHEFSQSEDEALEFAIMYGISRGLQQKRLAINEVDAMLGWLIHEVEGRIQNNESYIKMLKGFFKRGKNKDELNR